MSEPLLRRLEEHWASLEQQQTSADLVSVELPTTTPDGPLLAAGDKDGRHLLIPLGRRGARALPADRRSRGVRLYPRPVEIDDTLRWYADLWCVDDRLTSAFTAMCADVVMRVELRPEQAVQTVRRVLAEWRELLRSGDSGLSANAMAGLFAELLVLERLLRDGLTDLEVWVGPVGRRHDFRLGASAIEVKATVAGDSLSVRVHGLDQLEHPEGGDLALAFLRLEPVEGGATSLQTLVERVAAACPDPVGFGNRLRQAGYRDHHVERYRATAFDVIDERWFEVGEGFPRLTLRDLVHGESPAGVTDVHYTVDLDVAQPYLSDSDSITTRFLS